MDIKSEIITHLITLFPKQAVVAFIAALPIFELRLAIPLAIFKFKLSVFEACFFSYLGNLLPVLPLLLFFKYFFHHLENIRGLSGFFRWWFRSVKKRSEIVRTWGFWGLVIFTAIPLPITGAWTGTVAASLFNFKIKKAFLAISIGVCIAGFIITMLSLTIQTSY
ncbi:MAG: small multi-drug export protein [Desulfobacteraceae bacterium]|nr:small multi-drug export protein [Desulfobacteraceae bacterium]